MFIQEEITCISAGNIMVDYACTFRERRDLSARWVKSSMTNTVTLYEYFIGLFISWKSGVVSLTLGAESHRK